MQIHVDSFDFGEITIVDEAGQTQEYDLLNELRVNEDNLMMEMLEQPSKFVYWSTLLEKLKYYQESEELKVEKVIARIDTEAREHYKGTETKATKDVVEAFRKQHQDYEPAMQSLAYYNFIVGKVTRIVKAFEQRKDMLQSYGKQIAEQKMYGQGAGTRMADTQYPPTPNLNNSPYRG